MFNFWRVTGVYIAVTRSTPWQAMVQFRHPSPAPSYMQGWELWATDLWTHLWHGHWFLYVLYIYNIMYNIWYTFIVLLVDEMLDAPLCTYIYIHIYICTLRWSILMVCIYIHNILYHNCTTILLILIGYDCRLTEILVWTWNNINTVSHISCHITVSHIS